MSACRSLELPAPVCCLQLLDDCLPWIGPPRLPAERGSAVVGYANRHDHTRRAPTGRGHMHCSPRRPAKNEFYRSGRRMVADTHSGRAAAVCDKHTSLNQQSVNRVVRRLSKAQDRPNIQIVFWVSPFVCILMMHMRRIQTPIIEY